MPELRKRLLDLGCGEHILLRAHLRQSLTGGSADTLEILAGLAIATHREWELAFKEMLHG
jgi:hypothetical protein